MSSVNRLVPVFTFLSIDQLIISLNHPLHLAHKFLRRIRRHHNDAGRIIQNHGIVQMSRKRAVKPQGLTAIQATDRIHPTVAEQSEAFSQNIRFKLYRLQASER